MPIAIRPVRPDDGVAIQEIERLAGDRFREVGLVEVADHAPESFEALADYAVAARAWVAVDEAGEAVGYALVDEVDGNAHLEQVSVRPDRQGEGVGRALLDRVREWAVQTGRRSITLTTFTDVAWNRPLYEHLGFGVLSEADLGPELRALRDAEAADGLDPAMRVCMRLELA